MKKALVAGTALSIGVVLSLLLGACGANQAAKPASEVNIAGKLSQPEGSFISKCADHMRLLATFAHEGNWVKEYSYDPDSGDCRGVPSVKQLNTQASFVRNATGDGAQVSLTNYKLNSFSGSDLSDYRGEGSEFYVKWEGICTNPQDLTRTGSCSEEYFFNYYSPYSGFPVIRYNVTSADGSISRQDWVTSNLYRQDWKKDCTKFEEITVKAGHFKTCLIETEKSKVWLGKTPFFQVIKAEVKEGQAMTRYQGAERNFRGAESIRTFELSEIAY